MEFTADDVVFTAETHMNTDGLVRSATYQLNVESVEAPDPHTVVFNLKRPNSRFHSLFTVRWNAGWIMPKHVFEGQDPLKFNFNPPVSLGAYTLHSYDPNGQWFTWQKREDWQRTTLARFGEPGPRYVTYVDPGPPDRRVIAQMNHELDIIHDVSPEGMFTLAREAPSSIAWFPGFPYAHPDPTLPPVLLNHQNPRSSRTATCAGRWRSPSTSRRSRWPPTAARRRSRRSPIPPTGTHPEYYHNPLAEWLARVRARHRPADDPALRPDDGPADRRHAASLHGRPDPGGSGRDHAALRRRLVEAGPRGRGTSCSSGPASPAAATTGTCRTASASRSGSWSRATARPVMTRAGTMIAQQWREFGIDAEPENAQAAFFTRRNGGDFEAAISWSVETWGGHPDLSFFLDSWHSQFVQPAGEVQSPRNW